MQWLQRSVYAREGATAMDHQESDSRILRGIPFFAPEEDLCYNINTTNIQHSLQEKSRQLSVFFCFRHSGARWLRMCTLSSTSCPFSFTSFSDGTPTLYLTIPLLPSLHQLYLRRALDLAIPSHSTQHARAALFASPKQSHKNCAVTPGFL